VRSISKWSSPAWRRRCRSRAFSTRTRPRLASRRPVHRA
jgi:hypothetical protein